MKFIKYTLVILISSLLVFNLSSCEEFEDVLTSEETAKGLKEALKISTDTSVVQTSVEDGYFENEAIKIFFPENGEFIIEALNIVPGAGDQLKEALVLKLNRAAEKAAPAAKDIFVNAITNMTIDDALNILKGNDDAATLYLRANADSILYDAFYPEIQTAMAEVGADVAWNEITTNYNYLAAVNPNLPDVDTDISAYTTNKALDGLFHVVADEEKKIRTDITHRVTELLRRVFKEQ